MPPIRSADSPQPRRNPPSCAACRVRKLKCDRELPCSNCRARHLACEYEGEHRSKLAAGVSNNAGGIRVEADIHHVPSLQERINRLEQAVFGSRAVDFSSPSNREVSLKSESPAALPKRKDENKADLERRWLEDVGIRMHDMVMDACEILPVELAQLETFGSSSAISDKPRIFVPHYQLALACLESYEAELDPMQPVLHFPTVRLRFENVYNRLRSGQSVPVGSVALILAICAHVGLWGLMRQLFSLDPDTEARITSGLTKQAFRALEYARMTSDISIDSIQTGIILIFHLGHLEGFASSARTLLAMSISMARGLGLHKTDAPNTRPLSSSEMEDIEIRRRIWWHLVGTDWGFSSIGGPSEGTYSIQPRQMAVHKPRNLTHADIGNVDERYSRCNEEQTEIGFYLQRMEICTVCREMSDAIFAHSLNTDSEQIPYGTILMLDNKLRTLLNNFPRFLSLENDAGTITLSNIDSRLGRQRALQQIALSLMMYGRLCKLHLPFLVESRSNSEYAFSRRICLEAARKIYALERAIPTNTSYGIFHASLFRLGGNLGSLLYASTVIVMDLCLNNRHDPEQIREMQRVVETLEQLKAGSQITTAYLGSLTDILRRYEIALPMTDVPTNGVANWQNTTNHKAAMNGQDALLRSTDAVAALNNVNQNHNLNNMTNYQPANGDANFDTTWRELLWTGIGYDLEGCWDGIMQDVEVPVI